MSVNIMKNLYPKVEPHILDKTLGLREKFNLWQPLVKYDKNQELYHFLNDYEIFDISPYCKPHHNMAIEIADKCRLFVNINMDLYFRIDMGHNFTCHEVIRECRLFADLDDHDGAMSKQDFDDLKNDLIEKLPDFIKQYFELNDNVRINILQTYAGPNTPYNSAHLFIEIAEPQKFYLFRSPKDQFNFWKSFLDKYNKFNKIFDRTLYTDGHQLRLYDSSKMDKPNSSHIASAQGKIFYCRKHAYGVAKYFDFGLTDSKEVLLQSFCALPEYVYIAPEENKVFLMSKEPAKTIYHQYEIKMLEDIFNCRIDSAPNPIVEKKKIIKKQSTVLMVPKFDRYKNWHYFVYAMKSIYYWKDPNVVLSKILNFMSERGWGEPYHKEQTTKLFNDAVYSNYSYNTFFKFLDVHLFDDPYIYSNPVVNYKPLDKLKKLDVMDILQMANNVPGITKIREDHRTIQVCKSACGTQKTRNIAVQYPHLNILFVNYRVSIKDDIVAKGLAGLDIADYQDDVVREKINNQEFPKYLAIQFESLHLLKHEYEFYDLAFFDEAPHIFGEINFSSKNTKTHKTTMDVFNKLMKTKHVIFSSANINYVVWKGIKSFLGNEKVHYSVNNYIDDEKRYQIQPLKSKLEFMDKMLKLALDGKKLCISSNCAKDCLNMFLLFKSAGIKKIKLMTAYTKIEKEIEKYDVNKDWINYDIVIYSPTVESGVSFEVEHFDFICNMSIIGTSHHLSIFQQLYRCRNPKEKIIYSYCQKYEYVETDEGKKPIKIDPMTEKNIRAGLSMEDFIKSFKNKHDAFKAIKDLESHFIDFKDPENAVKLLNDQFNRWSQLKLCSNLYNELKDNGCTILPYEQYTFDVERNEIVNNELRRMRKEFYLFGIARVGANVDPKIKKSEAFKNLGISWSELEEKLSDFFIKITGRLKNLGIETVESVKNVIENTKNVNQIDNLYRQHKFECIMRYYPEVPTKINITDDEIKIEKLAPSTDIAIIANLFNKIFKTNANGQYSFRNENTETELDKIFLEFLGDNPIGTGINKLFPTSMQNMVQTTFGERLRRINGIFSKVNLQIVRKSKKPEDPKYYLFDLVEKIDIKTINPFECFNKKFKWCLGFLKKHADNPLYEDLKCNIDFIYALHEYKDNKSFKEMIISRIPESVIKVVLPKRYDQLTNVENVN